MSNNTSNFLASIGGIERLKGRENYETWKMSARAALELSGLWGHVDGTDSETNPTTKAAGDAKARSKLTLLVETINYSHIQSATSAKQVWDNLKKAFEDSGLMRRVGLLRKITNTKLVNCKSMEDFVNTILTTAHKLGGAGLKVDDEWLGTLLLAGLGEEYQPMIMAIESSGTKISSDFVKSKLLQDVGVAPSQAHETSNALYMRQRGHGGKGKNGYNGNRGAKKQFDTSKIKCFECNQMGHIGRECPKRVNKDKVHRQRGQFSYDESKRLVDERTGTTYEGCHGGQRDPAKCGECWRSPFISGQRDIDVVSNGIDGNKCVAHTGPVYKFDFGFTADQSR